MSGPFEDPDPFDWRVTQKGAEFMDPQQDVIVLPDKHPLRIRAEKAEAQRDELLTVLKVADAAINPPKQYPLSMRDWDALLKEATVTIRAAIAKAEGK